MKMSLKHRSSKANRSFLWKSGVLLSAFLVVSNVGFLFAQGVLPDSSALMRLAIRGDAYLTNSGWFLEMRNSALIPSFGIAMLVFVVLFLAHFFTFGPKDMALSGEDDVVEWWSLYNRIVHALSAVVFCVLFATGLLITFGKYFGGAGPFLRQVHEFAGLVYVPILALMILMWVVEAIPRSYDLKWFVYLGGYLGYKGPLKSEKFNAGQKLWYWVMCLTGIVHASTGLSLYFRWGELELLRAFVVAHLVSTIPLALMFTVHLYMTTLGTKGAFMGIVNGKFSRKAAENYHSEAKQLQS